MHSPEFASELTLDLQAHLRQIELIDELTAKVRSGLAEIVEALNPQSGLVLRLFEDVDAGFRRFFYGTQKVPFLGREKELAALSAFLYTPKRFAWWLVAGAGGLGKSLLALELCLCQGMVWRAGFLPDDYKPEDFRNWRPSQPTLLVADYVTARAEILGQIARRLYDRRDELDFPVRLLLLERDSDGQWLSQFRGKGGDALAIDDARHAREHVPLEGLGESDLWHTIELLLGDAGAAPPNRQEAMTALASIDPSGRPLFAAFFADSIAANPGATGWSRKDLLDDVLDREAEKRWKPAGITTVEKDLLAIATMGGGIDLSDDELPEAIRQRLRGGDFSPERYQLLSGQAAQERLAPLEPDILGEVFVLNHLSPAFHGDTERAERARQVAWHLRHGFGMFSFLSRAAADFPNEETLILLSRPATEEPLTRYVWTMAGVNLVAHLGAAGQIEPARELYDAIAGLAQSHPDEPALREAQAKAATNLVAHLGTAGQIEPARELYDAIAGLAQSHPDEPALREQQANAATKLVAHLGTAGQIEPARELYDAIAGLAQSHPDEPALREQQANAAFNLLNHYSAAGQIEPARELYDAIAGLAQSHPDEPALREQQAKAAFNLIVDFGNAGQIEPARELYDAIAGLAQSHPDEPALREQQAKAAFNLIVDFGNAGQIEPARELYDAIAGLAQSHPDEPALRELQANAAFNLLNHYSAAGQIEPARELYDAIAGLAQSHPDEPPLREEQAKAALAIALFHGRNEGAARAQPYFEEFKRITEENPENPSIQKLVGMLAKMMAQDAE